MPGSVTVQSVERAVGLLVEIGRRPGGLVDVAERVDLPVSTTARLLGTLESSRAIKRDADGTYLIGPAIHGLAGRAADDAAFEPRQSLQDLVHPHLIELAESLDEAACLAVVAGRDIVTVDQVDGPKPVQAENWTGTRVPLHAGGAGLVAMATWPDTEVEAYLAGELAACSLHTVTDPAKLRRRITRARTRRALWTHGEYVDGLSSASAALIDSTGRSVGAIYTYGPSYRYPARGKAGAVAAEVLAHADTISASLGWRP